jgi:hypothetical protein
MKYIKDSFKLTDTVLVLNTGQTVKYLTCCVWNIMNIMNYVKQFTDAICCSVRELIWNKTLVCDYLAVLNSELWHQREFKVSCRAVSNSWNHLHTAPNMCVCHGCVRTWDSNDLNWTGYGSWWFSCWLRIYIFLFNIKNNAFYWNIQATHFIGYFISQVTYLNILCMVKCSVRDYWIVGLERQCCMHEIQLYFISNTHAVFPLSLSDTLQNSKPRLMRFFVH